MYKWREAELFIILELFVYLMRNSPKKDIPQIIMHYFTDYIAD
jgi:hypothetical protein